MPYINNKTAYSQDTTVSGDDFLIGSTVTGETKTYSVDSLTNKFAEDYEGIGIVMKYADTVNIDFTPADSGYFTSNTEDLTNVVTLNINKNSTAGVDLTNKLSTLLAQVDNVNLLLRIENTSNINIYGYYNISTVVDNTTYYTLTVSLTSNLESGVLVDLTNYYLRFEVTTKSFAEEGSVTTILLNNNLGINYSNNNVAFASGTITVDITGAVTNGYATVLMNLSANPTLAVTGGSATFVYPNGDTINSLGDYEVIFSWRFGKISVYIPSALGTSVVINTPNAPTALTLTQVVLTPDAPTALTLTEGTV